MEIALLPSAPSTLLTPCSVAAQVRAGREMLESGRKQGFRSSRFPGLVLQM